MPDICGQHGQCVECMPAGWAATGFGGDLVAVVDAHEVRGRRLTGCVACEAGAVLRDGRTG